METWIAGRKKRGLNGEEIETGRSAINWEMRDMVGRGKREAGGMERWNRLRRGERRNVVKK